MELRPRYTPETVHDPARLDMSLYSRLIADRKAVRDKFIAAAHHYVSLLS